MFKIYVIIPVYNASAFLISAVESVINQSCGNIQIVLIDDGSTDESGDICRELADKYTNVTMISQENKGVSAARNRGIEHVLATACEASYIAFLDADDFWHPDFLEQAYCNISDQAHDIYAYGMLSCDQNAERFSYASAYSPHIAEGGNDAIWSITNHFASNLYKVSLLKKWNIRFFEDCKYSEDKYFKMQCCFFAESISFEQPILYVYRANSTGAMQKSRRISAIDYYLPIVDGWIKSDAFINKQSAVSGKTVHAGNVLACVYLLDMAKAQFMQWKSRKAIYQVLNNHPFYTNLKDLKQCGNKDSNYKNKELLLKHPFIFECKYRIIGIIFNILRSTLKIPAVRKFRNSRKYPLNKLI